MAKTIPRASKNVDSLEPRNNAGTQMVCHALGQSSAVSDTVKLMYI